jgi:hypothetical protein
MILAGIKIYPEVCRIISSRYGYKLQGEFNHDREHFHPMWILFVRYVDIIDSIMEEDIFTWQEQESSSRSKTA